MLAGKQKYESFVNKQKKEGKTHKEAVALWKESKSSPQQSSSVKVVSKSKPRTKKKRGSGFSRPKTISEKLKKSTARSRINLSSIKRIY